mgnify:FL=1
MKRLRLIALARDRDELLSSLLHAGCVEVSEPPADLADPLLRRDKARVAEAKSELAELKQALSVLRRQAPQKEGLLTPRQVVRERDLLDHGAMAAALEKARTVNDHAKAAGQCSARETRLNAELQSLRPWEACDLPLNEAGTRCVAVLLGTVPSAVDFDAMAGAVSEAAEASQVTLLSADGQQQCLEVLVHRSQEGAALEALRSYGFSLPQFKDASGTARDNVRRLEEELEAVRARRQAELDAIRAMGPETGALKLCVDQVQQVLATEETKERILAGGSILCLDGWVDEPNVSKLEQALAAFDCAWELTDPAPEEYPKVPVKLQNGPLTRCMNMVTEMYALPVYGTVDPNPLMAPFFILFYGIMMADMGYGILMVLGAIFMIKKLRAKGGMRNFAELLFYCGISTFVLGAITGGFFGDFLTQLVSIISPGTEFALPALFTPMNDTIAILGGSLVLGFIQIITGQIVSFVEKTRKGHLMDAIWDEGTWWVLYLAVGLLALGVGNIAGYPVVLIIGIVMLAVGSTRNAKGFGKIGSFVGAVYNGVTGIFSDVMSYARLMALMLSGSIIASVFNTLGGITGNVFFFLLISMLGNTLNFALNLLGCYVHDLRLQCLEFFGKFYQDGGKPFRPLAIHTKYVDIKEEN